ncbi:hypothetical protein [Rhodopirellula sp. MGV]|uniref:hypothetical protein n=1 Tax=Rhodopirellula sp. MGV TaxID=2023130 RepID=UPI000B96C897|nr:hypothetical protein [Rhodopirellula sp. MGV]OYP31623.1 hypothetical protein CGZ80_20960 [Rhodopirellula sp. MGV]PNY33476.1 hypothetical protein C2E31_28725 [Rhodopirellula baltica]
MNRDPSSCPSRVSLPQGDGEYCQLIQDLVNDVAADPIRIDHQACQACCGSFLPTSEDWNPVVASKVFEIADRVLQQADPSREAWQKATQLVDHAINQLPIVLAHEDDLVDDRQQQVHESCINREQFEERLPRPEVTDPVHSPVNWSVAITTAPRRQPTLHETVGSLEACGWTSFGIVVDGDEGWSDSGNWTVLDKRTQSIGAWPTWVETLRRLYQCGADVLMIVQDDALFPRIDCLRDAIESCLWPNDRSIVSLYTSTDDMLDDNRWQAHPRRWQLGALAMIFPRSLAADLLTMVDRGELEIVRGNAGIDTRIGVWAERQGIEVWHPSPSLVQHIGQVSAVWRSSRAVGLRRASRWIADE